MKVKKQRYVPDVNGWKSPGQSGKIVITPSRIVAPVGSEVVVSGGAYAETMDTSLKTNRSNGCLSNNSVGELIEIGGNHHPTFNKLIPPTSKKDKWTICKRPYKSEANCLNTWHSYACG